MHRVDPGELCLLPRRLNVAGTTFDAWTWGWKIARPSPETYAARVALGPLVGSAGLSLTCSAHTRFSHLFVFHLLGVGLAACAGLAVGTGLARA